MEHNERSASTQAFHLLPLCVAAFAAPLFIALGAQAEFFTARRALPLDIIGLVLVVTFFPPIILILLELMLGVISARLRAYFHLVLVGILVLLFAQGVLHLWLPLSITLAGAFLWLYQARDSVFRALTRLWVVALAFPLLFIFFTPIKSVVFTSDLREAFAKVRVTSTTPVFFLLFDELPLSSLLRPDLRIDKKSFPNFYRLQQDSLWYRNVITVSDDTMRAVPSILSGTRAPIDKPPILPNYPRNLFTMLLGGYRLVTTENLTSLAPLRLSESGETTAFERRRIMAKDTIVFYLHMILPPSQAVKLPPIDKGWIDFSNELERPPREDSLLPTLKAMTASGPPTLYYCHTNLPHYPYSFLPDGQEYDAGGDVAVAGLNGSWEWSSPWSATLAYQRHLLQAMFCDRLLGMAIDRLKQVGLFDRALVVVLADHGACYRFGVPNRPVVAGNIGQIAPVPLLIKLPGQKGAGEVIDRPVTTLDVLPTIASVLGIELPWRLDGNSLLDGRTSSLGRRIDSDLLKSGKAIAYPDDLRPLKEASEYKAGIFGGSLEHIYSFGPDSKLVGSPWQPEGQSTYKAEFLWPGLLQDVDLKQRFLPNRLSGYLNYTGRPLPLAIGINGKVAATTWTEPAAGESRFSAIIDPQFLKDGANSLSLSAVGGDSRLLAIKLDKPVRYQLINDRLASEGGSLLATADGVQGKVESMILEAGGFRIAGWAVTLKDGHQEPVRELAVFQDGRFLLTAKPAKDGMFFIGLPRPVLDGSDKVRVFAVTDTGAKELSYLASYREKTSVH